MTLRRVLAMSLAVLLAGPAPIKAAERPKIATLNLAAQAGLTLLSAAIHKKIRTPRDVVRSLWAGAASGAGVFAGKALIGDGHVSAGWIVANLSGSLSDNVIAGRHPIGQLGYSFGPFRVRVSVPPFDKTSDSLAHLDLSVFETVALAIAAARHDHVALRSGMITFRRDTPYNDQDDLAGWTVGIFPGVVDRDQVTFRHEALHAAQFLQLDNVEPVVFPKIERERQPGAALKWIQFGRITLGTITTTNLLVLSQPYEERWVEVEAYRLAENTSPPE